jgi:hypothetical protein
MKIEIEWISDSHDCETCGGSYAEGAVVKFDGDVVVDMTPFAHCFDSVNFTSDQVHSAILELLGHEVVETTIETGYDYESEQDERI